MNINPASAYGVYKSMERAAGAHPSSQSYAEAASVAKGENTDQIQISAEGTRQLEIEKAAKSIMAEIETPASPERLESLRAAVSDHSYQIPTDRLVDSLMSRWFGM